MCWFLEWYLVYYPSIVSSRKESNNSVVFLLYSDELHPTYPPSYICCKYLFILNPYTLFIALHVLSMTLLNTQNRVENYYKYIYTGYVNLLGHLTSTHRWHTYSIYQPGAIVFWMYISLSLCFKCWCAFSRLAID